MIPRVLACSLAVSAIGALGAAGLPATAQASALPATSRNARTAARTAALATKVGLPYDFNGDGYTDLALGDPYGTVSGKSTAGFVTIVYGSAAGANTKKKQVISQNTSGVPGVAEKGDHFGFALASLDFDRDGYADLLVGTPDEDNSGGTNAGGEWILWGGPSGLSGTGSQTLSEPETPGANHRYGFALATGDFDGDGYTDWVDTAPGEPFFWWYSSNPEGVTAMRSGGRLRRQAHRMTLRQVKKSGTKQVRAAATTGVDALIPAIGDVNGDGKDDLLMGWRNASAATPADRYGFDVWTGPLDASAVNEVLTPLNSLAVADFDGDGHADVAVGSGDESDGVGGHVKVFKGDAQVSLADSTVITQDTSGVPGTAVAGDRFGYSLAAGDVNRDGKADLAVGVPYRTAAGKSQAGEAVMLYGGANGLSGSGSRVFAQSTAGVPGAAETGDRFGWAVSLLDLNQDGYADLVAGAPIENSKDGAVSVLKGTSSGVTASGSATFGAGTLGVKGIDAQIGVRIGRIA